MLKQTKRHFLQLGALVTVISLLAINSVQSLNNPLLSEYTKLESTILDSSKVDANFDARAAHGEDYLEKMNYSSPTTTVKRDPITGETVLIESKINDSLSLNTISIEPHIPNGLEVISTSEQFTPFSVIGTDNRSQITNVDTYPYSAVALLEMTYVSGSSKFGTGAFVSSTSILTAGHNVYDQEEGWAQIVIMTMG